MLYVDMMLNDLLICFDPHKITMCTLFQIQHDFAIADLYHFEG